MILIFDENLSPRLLDRLSDIFDNATHVELLGLKGRDDTVIWERTRQIESAIIVSKDDDFRELALLFGPPPKVLMLQVGNCPTHTIERLLRENSGQIKAFSNDPSAALLELTF